MAGLEPGASADSPLLTYIAAGLFIGAALPVPLACHVLLLSLPVGLLLVLGWQLEERWHRRRAAWLLYALSALLLGHALSAAQADGPRQPMLIDAVVSVRSVQQSDYGQSLRCEIVEQHLPAKLKLRNNIFSFAPAVPVIQADDVLRLRGLAEWNRRYHNWQLRSTRLERLQSQEQSLRAPLWQQLEMLPRHRGLAAALLLGSAPRQEKQQFRSAGLAHVLVVSGLHVGIVFMLCAWLLRGSGLPWWPAQFALIAVLIFYLFITGAAIPTQRAVLMAAVIILANMLGRDLHKYAALSLTVIVLVLWDPLSARGLSFQLSLAAVAGILSLGLSLRALRLRYLPMRPWPLDRPSWRLLLFCAHAICDGLVVGLAATLAVTPILAAHMGVCNPWSPLATVLVTPLVTLVIASGGIWLACSLLWNQGPWYGLQLICDRSLHLLDQASFMLSSLPGSELSVSAPPWPVLLCWPLLFAPLAALRQVLWRLLLLCLLLLIWYYY